MSKHLFLPRAVMLRTFLAGSFVRLRKEPFERRPLQVNEIQDERIAELQNVFVERVRFWSRELQQPRFFIALVPKTTPATDVLILNHGWADRPEYLLKYLKVDQTYDALLGRNELRRAIIVMPDIRFSGRELFRKDSQRHPEFLRYVAEEIFELVADRYHVAKQREHWSIGGFSFGGFVSLNVARLFPGRFSSLSVVSSFANPNWAYWPAHGREPLSGDAKDRDENAVIMPGPCPSIMLACGSDDKLFGIMQSMHEQFVELEIEHEWEFAPGGHTWSYWYSLVPKMLRFHLRAQGDRGRC